MWICRIHMFFKKPNGNWGRQMATGNAGSGSPKSGKAVKSETSASAPETPAVPAQPPEVPPISRPMQMTPEDMAVLLERGVGDKLKTVLDLLAPIGGIYRRIEYLTGAEGRIRAEISDVFRRQNLMMIAKLWIAGLVVIAIVVGCYNGCQIKDTQSQVADVQKAVEALRADNAPFMSFVAAEKIKHDEAERLVREAAKKAFETDRDNTASCVTEIAECVKSAHGQDEVSACMHRNPCMTEPQAQATTEHAAGEVGQPAVSAPPKHRVINSTEEAKKAELIRTADALMKCAHDAKTPGEVKACTQPKAGTQQ